MVKIDNTFILDYPNLITTKAITEEGQRVLRETMEMIRDFMKDNDITIVNSDGIKILK